MGSNNGCVTHGMTRTRFYRTWGEIKKRCSNPNAISYHRYGGRGITFCKSWLKFENFRDDMYDDYLKHVEEHGENNTSIDRINNSENYCKSNCKWATREEQAGNTRNSKWFSATSPDGNTYTSKNQCKFARDNNLCDKTINTCLKGKMSQHRGWTFQYLTDKEVESYLNANNNNIKGVG